MSLFGNNRPQVHTDQVKIEESEIDKVDLPSDDKSADDEWKSHWGIKCSQCEQTWTSKAAFDEHYRLLCIFFLLICISLWVEYSVTSLDCFSSLHFVHLRIVIYISKNLADFSNIFT